MSIKETGARTMLRTSLIAVPLVLLMGCSTFKKTKVEHQPMAAEHATIVASDFASVIADIRGLPPLSTTLNMRVDESLFGAHLYSELKSIGYGIRFTSDTRAKYYVSYSKDDYQRSGQNKIAYKVSVGAMSLAREYETRAGMIYPTSAMSVVGGRTNSPMKDNWAASPMIPTVRHGFAGIAAPTSASAFDVPVLVQSPVAMSNRNLSEVGISQFQATIDTTKLIKRRTMHFFDESPALLRGHSRRLQPFANIYADSTDVFHVVGCSQGKTGVKGGNRVLAVGRTNAIVEELKKLGVSSDNILAESCWSSKIANSRYPKRGVVVTLRRSKGK